MENKYQNFGVLVGERSTDYHADVKVGALPYEIRNESGDYEPWLPPGEWQASDRGDSMSCVTFGSLNAIETEMNRLLQEGKMPDDLIQWSVDKGYLKKRL